MKILVTGHKGFIGSHLVPLLKKKHQVRGYDIKDGKDIFEIYELERAVKWADTVIHLAAFTNVRRSNNQKLDCFNLNVGGLIKVFQQVERHNKRLIFPSSGAYYIKDSSPYAHSKAIADEICQYFIKDHPITILRFFNVYGVGMNPDSGSLMYQFAKDSKQGELTVWGPGKARRDFINVRDIAAIIVASLDKKWIGQIVDVGTGWTYSIGQVAELFAKYSGAKVKFDKSKKEIAWVKPDTTKLKSLYKKKLQTDLEADIKEILNGSN